MATSVATLKYGSYVFDPVPQLGFSESIGGVSGSNVGGASKSRDVSIEGQLLGANLNEIQTKIWALESALSVTGLALYWHDGTSLRINQVITEPIKLDVPAEWGQYTIKYSIKMKYYPDITAGISFKYGDYVFDPVPQIGMKDGTSRLGESGMGAGNRERILSLRGKVTGTSLTDVQAKMFALSAALAKEYEPVYWYDGTVARINNVRAQPTALDFAEDWTAYEANYTAQIKYWPLGETHYGFATCKYGRYEFTPPPVMGREYNVQRATPEAAPDSTKVTVTLNGILDKGTVALNLTALADLETALKTDGLVLQYGTFTQAVRVQRLSYPPDTHISKIPFTAVFEYDSNVGTDGVTKMTSQRQVQSSQRIAKMQFPFVNGSLIQQVGGNGQIITATGSITALTIAEARTAAAVEILSMFPEVLDPTSGKYEETRNITEDIEGKKVDWQVVMYYTQPALVGGVYGDLTI